MTADDSNEHAEIDWSSETNYSKLLQIPEVRDKVAMAARKNEKNMSIEEMFDVFDDTLKPLTGGVSLGKLAAITLPIASRFGIGVNKERSADLSIPPGKTIVRVLCLFAEAGQKVIGVEQADDGCIIEARMPSDFLSWEGTILVRVQQHRKGTHVEATTKIKGQMLDFGKSERLLGKLFKCIGDE